MFILKHKITLENLHWYIFIYTKAFKNYFKDKNQIFNSIYLSIVEEWISNGSGD